MLILRGGGEGGVVRELFMLTLCGGGGGFWENGLRTHFFGWSIFGCNFSLGFPYLSVSFSGVWTFGYHLERSYSLVNFKKKV